MLREVLQEIDFVRDLGYAKRLVSVSVGWETVCLYARTMTFVLISAVMTESLLIRSRGDRFGSR